MPGLGYTVTQLCDDLRALGVEIGDILFVHSSFKSLGMIQGGAETVITAFENALGVDGVLLMPSFNLIGDREQRASSWHIAKTKSSVGWLTEYFRLMPGTHRADHYSHSVAARGQSAKNFVADHLSEKGLTSPWDRPPWGKTYGTNSPMMRAYEQDGKLLMLGIDYQSSTYIHVVEVMFWNERLKENPNAEYIWLDRVRLGEVWDRSGILETGKVGDAACRLFRIRAYVDQLLNIVRDDPDSYDRVKLDQKSTQP
ncbi:MAG: AAC(3) family N-acetyltransferase [Candidatus Latescibacteria bacterium]|nr:AAC(3) family N-acetyltransferase [Candidatus Latescibacterota bacterium]